MGCASSEGVHHVMIDVTYIVDLLPRDLPALCLRHQTFNSQMVFPILKCVFGKLTFSILNLLLFIA